MQHIPVVIFGAGGVGRELLTQIINSRQRVAERNQLQFDVVAIVDSRSWLWAENGLSDERINAGIQAKLSAQKMLTPNQGKDLTAAIERTETRRALHEGRVTPLGETRPSNLQILEGMENAGISHAIIVDVTATDGMEATLTKALDMGYGVALANKKPLAGAWETAKAFYAHPYLRHESTVGGGQPVVATMRYFMDTNDPVYHVEGQLSGTLGYICQQLDNGTKFSNALLSAKVKGYTEPDPREDLSGMDVMRKVLILGRMAGWALEPSDINVESLYPSSLSHLPVNEFMTASVALDPSFQDRVNAAAASGEVLRYVGEVSKDGGTVGLKSMPVESPMANLKYIRFTTGNYNDEAMVIAGKGAGVAMTAAGVLGDMIDLGREMK